MTEPVFLMAWRCDGETVTLPLVDRDGDPTLLAREMVAAFDARGIDPAAAVYRHLAADRAEIIVGLKRQLRESGELAEHYRELFGGIGQ